MNDSTVTNFYKNSGKQKKQKLAVAFDEHFLESAKCDTKFEIFGSPFNVDVSTVPEYNKYNKNKCGKSIKMCIIEH